MRTEVHTSITQIDRDEWNTIVDPNRLICRHEYLEAIENSKINDCRYFYPVIRDESGKLLAHTCLYFISTELDLFATGALKWGIQKIRKLWPSFLILRSVECGTPVALGNTISFADGNREELLFDLVEAAEQVAADLNVKVILFRDFYDDEIDFYDRFTDRGYKRIHNLPCTRLSIRWNSFDTYLASMRSQYRKRIQSRARAFSASGCKLEIVDDISSIRSDVFRLWQNVFDHAKEYKRERLTEAYLDEMDKRLGDRMRAVLAWKDEKLIGFIMLLYDADLLVPLFCGLDYAQNRETFVYFNMHYEVVREAIDAGMKEIDFGITTTLPKIDMGAVVRNQYMYMKHTNKIGNLIVPRLFDVMTPQPKIRSRRVFKTNDDI
jgi:predicted N-acyltransferase